MDDDRQVSKSTAVNPDLVVIGESTSFNFSQDLEVHLGQNTYVSFPVFFKQLSKESFFFFF